MTPHRHFLLACTKEADQALKTKWIDLDFVLRHCVVTPTRYQCRKCWAMYKHPDRAEKHLEQCLKISTGSITIKPIHDPR